MFYCSQIPYSELAAKTLVFSVYDFDRFSKHDQIGQIQVALNSVDLGQVVQEWRDLHCPEADSERVIIAVFCQLVTVMCLV